jgi:hypothetical protein
VVASPYPCQALKAVGKYLNGFDCLEWLVRCCVLLKQGKVPVKRKLASGKAGCNKQVCLATFLSMFRVQRELAEVQQ